MTHTKKDLIYLLEAAKSHLKGRTIGYAMERIDRVIEILASGDVD